MARHGYKNYRSRYVVKGSSGPRHCHRKTKTDWEEAEDSPSGKARGKDGERVRKEAESGREGGR